MSLPKPLGVIQRSNTLPSAPRQVAHDHDAIEDDMDVREANGSDGAAKPQWDMIAIVKKKVVFSKRPMPIVGKAAVAMGTDIKKS